MPSPVESMNEERAKASFSIRELTYLLDGGEKSTLLKERFMQEFERDPLFKMDDIHDITKDELRERTMEKYIICPMNLSMSLRKEWKL
ncbi:Putative Acyl-coenzyme A oxidase [Rhizopus microsporus]|nr:Putative Acyl-coenzyme A oxidase [Rhizopus microsporus]